MQRVVIRSKQCWIILSFNVLFFLVSFKENMDAVLAHLFFTIKYCL